MINRMYVCICMYVCVCVCMYVCTVVRYMCTKMCTRTVVVQGYCTGTNFVCCAVSTAVLGPRSLSQ